MGSALHGNPPCTHADSRATTQLRWTGISAELRAAVQAASALPWANDADATARDRMRSAARPLMRPFDL
jgi:hypothetical protein